jgi:hypothetical protein
MEGNKMEQKKRLDIMCDLETLGIDSDAAVFQISAIAFDIETGTEFCAYNEIADIANSRIIVNGSTLKWWLNTDKELLANLLNAGTMTEHELVEDFHSWLTHLSELYDLYFWGNGILFDNRFVKEKFESNGLKYPIFFRNDRDVRTLLELAAKKTGISEKEIQESCIIPNTEKHNAIDDVRFQIGLATKCWQILMK